MIYNYHTHTLRCSHATGTPEEYIKKAIENGIKYMGFSDHAPYIFPDGHESGYRVPVSQAEDYINEITALRDKYADKIDIKVGFEMEYYPTHFEKMLKNAVDFGAQYLILGQHFLREEHPGGVACTVKTADVSDLKEYVDTVVKAIKSGVFTYVAHPDVLSFVGEKEAYIEEMRKICIASRENDVPLEINFLGIRTNRFYPNETFWKIAGEEKSPVTFGFDAHDTESAYDGKSLEKAKAMVEKYGLNYIGKPQLRPVRMIK